MILSPALFRKKNLKWLLVVIFLIFMNMAVVWLWAAFLTLRFQRYLMYLGYLPVDSRRNVPHPQIRTPVHNADEDMILLHDTLVESIYFKSRDGTKLHAHFYRFPRENLFPSPKGVVPTILFFHGTSGNIGHRIVNAHILTTLCMCNVMLVNIRGYGLSDGEAHRIGIQQDTQAALDYLRSASGTVNDIDASALFVLGQSLGGAFAIDLAMRNPGAFKGVIIDNTFTRLKDLVPEVLPPFAPIRDYITEDWDSLTAIESCPAERFPSMLFVLGNQDELISSSHGKALFAAASEKAKANGRVQAKLVLFPYGHHVHTFREPFYFDAIAQFVNEIKLS